MDIDKKLIKETLKELKEFDEIIQENDSGYFEQHMWGIFNKFKIKGKEKNIQELLEITTGLEYEICSYVKNYDNKYKKYLNFKDIYHPLCARDTKEFILRRYIAIKLRENIPAYDEKDYFWKESKAIINPIFEGKYILYRRKGQSMERIYNTFEDFILSGDQEFLFCNKAHLQTKNQIINDLKLDNSDTDWHDSTGIDFFNNIDNYDHKKEQWISEAQIEVKDPLLNNINIYNLYDLYKSKMYGIAKNGYDYINDLRIKSYKASTEKKEIIESKIDVFEKLSDKEKIAVNNSHSEAHVLFSHDEYLDYLNGDYQKDKYEGDGGYYIFKINKELVRQLGCNDHFQAQAEKLKIFLNHTEIC
tara:strand:- start:612 stop:1691 length:1080 start_codon:yes stop_codon:yes gene_type:complete